MNVGRNGRSWFEERSETRDRLRVRGISDEVARLGRVGFVIVQLDALTAFVPLGVSKTLGAHGSAGEPAALDLGERGVIPRCGRVGEEGAEGTALEGVRWGFKVAKIDEGGIQIEEFDEARG